ncbi:MAG TPA: CAP domain-containing protein [Tepidiformaceae bacterium]|nr:CAP domain-containing protein [Tepidiformaceae bacterium]
MGNHAGRVLMTNRWTAAAMFGASLVMLGSLAVGMSRGNVALAQTTLVNCSTTTGGVDHYEAELIGLINAYRAANGRGLLKTSPGLSRAAAWQSEYLAGGGAWSHNGPPDRTFDKRIKDCGYTGSVFVGENIAMNFGDWRDRVQYPSPVMTLEQWKASPGHNAALLSNSYTVIGVGFASSVSGTAHYWTADFGDYEDPGTTGPILGPPPAPPPPPPPTSTPTPFPTSPAPNPPVSGGGSNVTVPLPQPTNTPVPTPTYWNPDAQQYPHGPVTPRVRVPMLARQ